MEKGYLLIVILAAALVFAVYGNSLNGQFIHDDNFLIKDNLYIKSWNHIPKIFTQDIGAGIGQQYGFYRPLQITSYLAGYTLWGFSTFGYHLFNILLHILVCFSLYRLTKLIFKDNLLSLFAAAVFALHPVQVETVAYISNTHELLSLLFMLVSFIFYINDSHKNNIAPYVLMLFSYALALLSKENSLILPILLLLYHFALKEKIKSGKFLSIAGVGAIYLLLRTVILRSPFSYNLLFSELLKRIPGFFAAITSYIRILILPFNLRMDYGYPFFNLGNPEVILGIVILVASLTIALKIRKTNSLVSFSILWFFVALIPVSGILPMPFYMAEHYLYAPSIGFFLIFAKLLCNLYRSKKVKFLAPVIILGIFFFYAFLTFKQNKYWKDPVTFSKRTLSYDKHNPRFWDELGVAYYNIGNNEKALAAFRKALEINPNDDSVYNNLGNLYYDMGKNKAAEEAYEKSLKTNPRYAQTYYNLGNLYNRINSKGKAVSLYKRAIEINPDYAKAYNNLSDIYYNMGKPKDAIEMLKKAVEIDPNFEEAHNNLGIAYYQEGRHDLAIEHLNKALRLGYEVNPRLLESLESLKK